MNWENIIIGVCFAVLAGCAYYFWKKTNEQNNTIIDLNKRIEAIELMFIPPPSQDELNHIFNQPRQPPCTRGLPTVINQASKSFLPGGTEEGFVMTSQEQTQERNYNQNQDRFYTHTREEPLNKSPRIIRQTEDVIERSKNIESENPLLSHCELTPTVIQTEEESLDDIADTVLKSMVNESSNNAIVRRRQV
jgi:hypothetical protein